MIKLNKLLKYLPLIGVFVFILMVYNIGFNKIVNVFADLPIEFFILSMIVFIPRLILFAYKWKIICHKQKININIFYLMKLYLSSLFYANITHGAFGIHFRLFYVKKKTNEPIEKCIMNSLLDIIVNFISGLFLAFLGTVLLYYRFPNVFEIKIITVVVLTFLLLYFLLFLILIRKKTSNKIFNFLIKYLIPSKFKSHFSDSIDSFYKDFPNKKDFILPFLINCIVWIVTSLQVYMIFLHFSIHIPFIEFILINIIASLFTGIIPISIGGLGIREGVTVFLFSLYNVDPQIAFTISFSGYIVKILLPSILGSFISFNLNHK